MVGMHYHRRRGRDRVYPSLLFPKATKLICVAGLLTCSGFYRLPTFVHRQWLSDETFFVELTATGIVPDLHRIPF